MNTEMTVPEASHDDFQAELDGLLVARRKITSPLYQVILSGRASRRLLQEFVIHRYPIKNFWTRNILGIASRIDDYQLRCELVENIYEEETGRISHSHRHLDTFVAFGIALGLTQAEIVGASLLDETKAVIQHNLRVCNSSSVPFVEGVASVLLLMEGQPPIVSAAGATMEAVMRDVYGLPREGYEFFTHHASSSSSSQHVSELEDDHAATARAIIEKYCTTQELRERSRAALKRAIELRHRHFDAIYRAYDENDPPFRWAFHG